MSKKTNAVITLLALLFLTALGIAISKMALRLIQEQNLLLYPAAAVILLLIILSIILHSRKQRRRRDAERQLREIDAMEGYQFEEYIAALLRRQGYAQVEVTRQTGDYGADITAAFDGESIGFQCKRSQQNVGVQGVKDISAGMQYYGCTRGVVVTNRYFTRQARELAEKCSVELWDRDALRQMLDAK